MEKSKLIKFLNDAFDSLDTDYEADIKHMRANGQEHHLDEVTDEQTEAQEAKKRIKNIINDISNRADSFSPLSSAKSYLFSLAKHSATFEEFLETANKTLRWQELVRTEEEFTQLLADYENLFK